VNVINAPEEGGSPVNAEGNGTSENMSKSMPSIPESLSLEIEGVPRKTISSTDLKSEDLTQKQ
jgi:hypothetical protein